MTPSLTNILTKTVDDAKMLVSILTGARTRSAKLEKTLVKYDVAIRETEAFSKEVEAMLAGTVPFDGIKLRRSLKAALAPAESCKSSTRAVAVRVRVILSRIEAAENDAKIPDIPSIRRGYSVRRTKNTVVGSALRGYPLDEHAVLHTTEQKATNESSSRR